MDTPPHDRLPAAVQDVIAAIDEATEHYPDVPSLNLALDLTKLIEDRGLADDRTRAEIKDAAEKAMHRASKMVDQADGTDPDRRPAWRKVVLLAADLLDLLAQH